jgi:hypothetical protein
MSFLNCIQFRASQLRYRSLVRCPMAATKDESLLRNSSFESSSGFLNMHLIRYFNDIYPDRSHGPWLAKLVVVLVNGSCRPLGPYR